MHCNRVTVSIGLLNDMGGGIAFLKHSHCSILHVFFMFLNLDVMHGCALSGALVAEVGQVYTSSSESETEGSEHQRQGSQSANMPVYLCICLLA